jgi:cobalamin biosynthesis protein CobD/CbiB
MKTKILNALLIITSLLGYLEWSGDKHSFLFQAEVEVVTKLFENPTSVLHPFTILPLLGQILLLITIFQKVPSKRLTFWGIGCLGLLLGFMFFIGLLSQHFKIMLSTIPFLISAIFTIRYYRKNQS